MVKIKDPSEFEKLETLLNSLCEKYNLKLFIDGWTRKTYDVYKNAKRLTNSEHIARIESLAVSNGEIKYFSDDAQDFVTELGESMESTFDIDEVILIKENRPEY